MRSPKHKFIEHSAASNGETVSRCVHCKVYRRGGVREVRLYNTTGEVIRTSREPVSLYSLSDHGWEDEFPCRRPVIG